jgi:restriction system protein
MKNAERYLVQAKHWRAKQVPVEVVRELAGVMPFRRAVGAYVVTSGRFTEPPAAFAEGRGITLVNGSKLQGLLGQARASMKARSAKSADEGYVKAAPPAKTAAVSPPAEATDSPPCPTCDAPMKLRTATRGANAGGSFWGCSSYPRCGGTRQV